MLIPRLGLGSQKAAQSTLNNTPSSNMRIEKLETLSHELIATQLTSP
jgi:hypothetical protein